jgi:hypothetical protein
MECVVEYVKAITKLKKEEIEKYYVCVGLISGWFYHAKRID